MIYTSHYESPLGNILLAGDEEGLTGLWFTDGGRYTGLGLKKMPFHGTQIILNRRKGGWMFISQAAIPASCRKYIWLVLTFETVWARSCVKFPLARLSHMDGSLTE